MTQDVRLWPGSEVHPGNPRVIIILVVVRDGQRVLQVWVQGETD